MSNMDCCSICLDIFKDEIYITSCGHTFHKSCIDDWYKLHSGKCPLCRQIDKNYIKSFDNTNHFSDFIIQYLIRHPSEIHKLIFRKN